MTPRNLQLKLVLFFLVGPLASALLYPISTLAQSSPTTEGKTPGAKTASSRRVPSYKLDKVTVNGTDRISAEILESEFGLVSGTPLNDELVMNTRSRLLSLGLFNSVILRMTKGSMPGTANLIVECEDDEQVLTDWAIGGEMSVTFTETTARSASPDGPPRGYRLGVVGRNILNEQHRASVLADVDARAIVREAEFAYGLPRFGMEDTQFDTRVHIVDVSHRYLNALGFGARGEALWTQSLESSGDFQYGMALYVNRKPRYSLPGFPTNVSGPKLGFHRETRFKKLVAGAGSLVEASILLAPIQTENSVAEIRLARTIDLWTWLNLTVDFNAMSVGVKGSSVRGETRFDLPFASSQVDGDQASAFLRLRGGFDRYAQTNLIGSTAIVGFRYHSSGFIAEIALQISRVPGELSTPTVNPSEVAP